MEPGMQGQPRTRAFPEGYHVTLGGRQVVVPFVCPPRWHSYRVEQLVCRRPAPDALELRLRPWPRLYFSVAYGVGAILLLTAWAVLWFLAPWDTLTAIDIVAVVAMGGILLAGGGWQLFGCLYYLGDFGRVAVDLAGGTAMGGYRPWSGFGWQVLLPRVLAVDLVQYQTNGLPVLPFQVNPDHRGSRWVVSLILDDGTPSSWGLTWSSDCEEARAAGRQLASALRLPFVDQMSVRPLPE
jgi:hypothetical protein